MKKLIFLAFFLLFSVSLVSAWNYEDSYSYGDADAYVEVVGNYPVCDGITHGNYCVGNYYVDVSYSGDKFYMGYGYTSWSPESNDNGYSGIPSSSAGRKILPLSGNQPNGYIICAWDYDEASNGDWSWTSQCGGYLVEKFNGLQVVDCYQDSDCGQGKICKKSGLASQDWSCQIKVCDENAERCFGSNLQKCEGNKWAEKGIVMNKCNVECLSESNCPGDNVSNTFCGGNDILQTNISSSCSNYKCESSTNDDLVESCDFKCKDIEDDGAICVEKVCDEGALMCSAEENSLSCYGNSWFLDKECGYGCEEGACKSFYTTTTFYTIVGASIIALIIVMVTLVILVSKRKR